jgi:hypothetical protein
MRAKVFIAVLVAFAVLFSFGTAKEASADAIMFPWLVKSPTVLSLLSVVNTSETTDCQGGPKLHYQYYYKSATAADLSLDAAVADATRICSPQSFYRPTSKSDIVSFDASGAVSDGMAMFNDQPPFNGNVTYIPSQFDMNSAPATARAFLLVDNNDTLCFEDWDSASLYGEALILQISQGSAWGYVAMNGVGGGAEGPASEPTLGFNDVTDLQGEALRSPRYYDDADDGSLETTPMVHLPLNTFITKMFVTPVNYAMWEFEDGFGAPYTAGPGARTGQANSRIQFCLNPEPTGVWPIVSPCPSGLPGIDYEGENCQPNAAPVCVIGGIFDNDEQPMDSQLPADVVCTAALDTRVVGLLLNQAQIDFMNTTPGGQTWTYVRSMVGSFWSTGALGTRDVRTMSDSLIGKLEYTEVTDGFTLEDVQVNGTVNDMKWIRNSATQEDNDWDLDRGINWIGESTWEVVP